MARVTGAAVCAARDVQPHAVRTMPPISTLHHQSRRRTGQIRTNVHAIEPAMKAMGAATKTARIGCMCCLATTRATNPTVMAMMMNAIRAFRADVRWTFSSMTGTVPVRRPKPRLPLDLDMTGPPLGKGLEDLVG